MSEPPVPRPALTGNHAIEGAAIAFVIDYERAAGREPRDTRHDRYAPADLTSGDRLIEVKAFGGTSRGVDLWLEPAQFDAATAQPERFHLYLVENVRQGDPRAFRLLDLCGAQLERLLAQAKPRQYYTVPWPVGEYERAAATSDA